MEKAFAYICTAADTPSRLLKRYCRKIYELGYVPICPKLSDSQYLVLENADEKREFQSISRQKLCRCRKLYRYQPDSPQIGVLTEQLKKLRHTVKLCRNIEIHSIEMEQRLQAAQQEEQQRQEKQAQEEKKKQTRNRENQKRR